MFSTHLTPPKTIHKAHSIPLQLHHLLSSPLRKILTTSHHDPPLRRKHRRHNLWAHHVPPRGGILIGEKAARPGERYLISSWIPTVNRLITLPDTVDEEVGLGARPSSSHALSHVAQLARHRSDGWMQPVRYDQPRRSSSFVSVRFDGGVCTQIWTRMECVPAME